MIDNADPDRRTILELTGVSKRIGNKDVLKHVDFEMKQGEACVIVGANGAGKSTLLQIIVGLRAPTQGAVLRYSDTEASECPAIGYIPQTGIPDVHLTVKEVITFYRRLYAKSDRRPLPTVEESIRAYALSDVRDQALSTLSGGMKRRVELAVVLMRRPSLLVLDEPTVGVDAEARELFWEQIRKLVDGGTSVLFTTHDLQEARALAARSVLLEDGRIHYRSTSSLASDATITLSVRFARADAKRASSSEQQSQGELTIEGCTNLGSAVQALADTGVNTFWIELKNRTLSTSRALQATSGEGPR